MTRVAADPTVLRMEAWRKLDFADPQSKGRHSRIAVVLVPRALQRRSAGSQAVDGLAGSPV